MESGEHCAWRAARKSYPRSPGGASWRVANRTRRARYVRTLKRQPAEASAERRPAHAIARAIAVGRDRGRAMTALKLYTLERDVFVPAVNGYRPASVAAEAVISRLLGGLRSEGVGAP